MRARTFTRVSVRVTYASRSERTEREIRDVIDRCNEENALVRQERKKWGRGGGGEGRRLSVALRNSRVRTVRDMCVHIKG